VILDQFQNNAAFRIMGHQLTRLRRAVVSPLGQVAVRGVVVLLALAIIWLRTPSTFTLPQFWGEDVYFFAMSRERGWAVLLQTLAGYHLTIQFLVGIFGSYFPPYWAPAIYNYSAVLLTLLVVWLVTSPRLDMPRKPLMALAVVIVPMGYEEIGTITNIQWILPIGAFALLFMRRASSNLVLLGEAIFLGLTSVSGPFSIFLTPIFLWRTLAVSDPAERRRLLVLSAVAGAGALVQVHALLTSPSLIFEPSPYHWTLWLTLPFKQIGTVFGPVANIFEGVGGFVSAALCTVLIAALALRRPFRDQKIAMIAFAAAIAFGGMWKFHVALGTQILAQRYFYCGSIFLIWFICCLSAERGLRAPLTALVIATEILLLPAIAGTPRIGHDYEWREWARFIDSGIPVNIPTAPESWYLDLAGSQTGRFGAYADWLGHSLEHVAAPAVSDACTGSIVGFVEHKPNPVPFDRTGPLWKTEGVAWDRNNKPVELIILADLAHKVIGFGFPGFRASAWLETVPARSKWVSYFSVAPGGSLRAYGLVDDGRALCLLNGARQVPSHASKLVTGPYVEPVQILPDGKIVQRFKPDAILDGVATQLVTYGRQPSNYAIDWKLIAVKNGARQEIGAGTINAPAASDWGIVNLPASRTAEVPDEIEVIFSTKSAAPAAPLGLPLFKTNDGEVVPPAEIRGSEARSRGRLALTLYYVR
jgi:hypothetical protein